MADKLVYVKIHQNRTGNVVAICDYELLGKKLVDRDKNITFYIDPYFYKGEIMNIDHALEKLKKARIANLIGNNIVEAAIDKGYISREAVLEISGVKHAQLIVIEAGE